MKIDKKKYIGNTLLTGGSFLFCYIVIEFFIFPKLLPFLPLKLHGYLGVVAPLAQSSKADTLPNDWIALIGDSYAQGKGDWLLTTDHGSNLPFHSAHEINRITGKDVVSFAGGGVGSVRGFVQFIVRGVDLLNASSNYNVSEPSTILAYFYEGNDLNNNLRMLKRQFIPRYGKNQTLDSSDIQLFIEDITGINEEISPRWWYNLFFLKFLRRSVEGTLEILTMDDSETSDTLSGNKKGLEAEDNISPDYNVVRIKGGDIEVPPRLQGPALELTEKEIEASLFLAEQSLLKLKSIFKNSRIIVVYIPSPLSSYKFPGQKISSQSMENRNSSFRTGEVLKNSQKICGEMQKISQRLDLGFFDSRPFIHEVTGSQLIHGPRDWKHFNRTGQQALGSAVAKFLLGSDEFSGCDRGAEGLQN